MNAWLVYDKADAERNKGYIAEYFSESKKRNIDLQLIYVDEIDYNPIKKPNFIIFRAIAPDITKKLEQLGFLVCNNSFTAEICNDKEKTYRYIKENNIDILDIYDEENIKFPCVAKAAHGRGGNQVYLVNNREELNKIDYKKEKFIFQKLANNPGKDLRVYVIGKRIIAAMLRVSKTDFRSNYSLGGEAIVYHLSDEEKTLVNKIIEKFDFGLVGIDFIFHNDKIIFNEIEDVVGARMLYAKTDINIAAEYLDFLIYSGVY